MIKQAIIFLFHYFQIIFIRKKNNSILLIPDYNSSGGTRTYFISLLYYLHENNFNVTILDNDNIRDNEINTVVKELECDFYSIKYDFWGIDFDNIPKGISKSMLYKNILKELNFWSSLLVKFRFEKLVFSTGYPGKNIYSFILPVKILYILHSSVNHKADKYLSSVLKIFLSKRKQILTVSNYSTKKIITYWLNGKSSKYVNFVHNYYSPKYNVPKKTNTGDVITVLTIGSVEDYKNPFFFIQIAKEVIGQYPEKSFRFLWAGTGSLLSDCKIETANFHEIQFLGEVENVENLYAEADIYFQPSLMESHGISVLGAMYHEIPCVVSNNGGLMESVDHGVNGYVVEVDDAIQSANRILTLLKHRQVWHEMGTNGKSIYNERFTKEIWQKTMKKILKINV